VQPDPVYEADGVTLAEVQPDPVYAIPPLTPTQKLVWDSLPTWDEAEQKYIQGWTVVDKTYEELLAEVPYKSLSDAQFALAEWINKLTYQIEGKFPNVVQKGWKEEEAMAKAYEAGTATQEQIDRLTTLGSKKGRTAQEHVTRVLELAKTYREIKDHVHDLWLETDGALEAAASPLEYEAIFDAAIAQAAPLAAAYGLSVEG